MKVIYDIETKPIIGGYKPGELVVFAGGRRTGKSMINQMVTLPKFSITDQAQVDGATWYTVFCNYEVSDWLRNQNKEWYYQAPSTAFWSKFDIHEKLYTVLALKWS